MTLRARLLLLTLSLVAIVAFALTALNLNVLASNSLNAAIRNSEMTAGQIQSFLVRRLTGPKDSWNDFISHDDDLATLLEGNMAQSGSIVEINIAGEKGIVLATSNPRRRGTPLTSHQQLSGLRDAGPIGLITALWKAHDDYETLLPLGINDQKTPVFTIQILVAPWLLRDTTVPALRQMAAVSSLALIMAFILAYWSARMALRPLERIGHLIDDIALGKVPQIPARRTEESRELAIIESKLGLLGERFRGTTKELEAALARLDEGSRKSIEHQLTMARRLTAINSLTRGVAHEIKNPLNSIALRLELLRSRVTEEAPDTDREFAILSEEVLRLDRVVRTFLDFNSPVELKVQDTDLRELTAEMMRFLETEAANRDIRTVCEGPAQPLFVRADADLLRQALLNISINGIEAMSSGGELHLHLEHVGDECVITISDTGPGIPKEQLGKVFQLYFTTKVKGSGIGLALAYRAVQLHGGTIEVNSMPGKGTTFVVTLPCA